QDGRFAHASLARQVAQRVGDDVRRERDLLTHLQRCGCVAQAERIERHGLEMRWTARKTNASGAHAYSTRRRLANGLIWIKKRRSRADEVELRPEPPREVPRGLVRIGLEHALRRLARALDQVGIALEIREA